MPTFDYREPVPDEIVAIFFLDTSYPLNGDDEHASLLLKSVIERETRAELEEVDVGAGASFPAWLMTSDLTTFAGGAVSAAILFSGRSILENLEAWVEIGKRLRGLILREVCLNRTAAAALALDEISKHLPAAPDSHVVLESYGRADGRYENFWDATQANANVLIERQGDVIHVFYFSIDSVKITAVVKSRDVSLRFPAGPQT